MKLLLVDDHPLVREGIAAVLAQAAPGTSVLHADDGHAALALAEAHADIDAMFVDLNMPGMGGVEIVRHFRDCKPELPVIVLSSSEDPADVRRVLALGALGYLPKSAHPKTMLAALQLVMSGEVYVPRFMADADKDEANVEAAGNLSARQREVLSLLCAGNSNKEISRLLGLAEKTTKTHVTAILRYLNVSNRAQAITAAQRAGLI